MATKKKGFLDIIKKEVGEAGYDGDQYGGAGGHDGRGLPTDMPSNFMFATGIECSYPTIKKGKVRRDQLRECGHYDRYKEDLGLVKELGLKVLRYGLPYYDIHKGPASSTGVLPTKRWAKSSGWVSRPFLT